MGIDAQGGLMLLSAQRVRSAQGLTGINVYAYRHGDRDPKKWTLSLRTVRPYHHDPFDRMLVAQALCDGPTLMTHDDKITQYEVAVLRVP